MFSGATLTVDPTFLFLYINSTIVSQQFLSGIQQHHSSKNYILAQYVFPVSHIYLIIHWLLYFEFTIHLKSLCFVKQTVYCQRVFITEVIRLVMKSHEILLRTMMGNHQYE